MAHDVESSSLGGGKPSSIISVGTHSRAWLPGARSEDVAKAISGLKEYCRLRTMKASSSSSRFRPVPGIVDRLLECNAGLASPPAWRSICTETNGTGGERPASAGRRDRARGRQLVTVHSQRPYRVRLSVRSNLI